MDTQTYIKTLLSKFHSMKECNICLQVLIPEEGCMFKCGHTCHSTCIKKMENPCCVECKYPYNPVELLKLSTNFYAKSSFSKNKFNSLYNKGLTSLVESALLDNPEAQFTISISRDNKYSLVNKFEQIFDNNETLFWLKKSANQKYIPSLYYLMNHYKNNDTEFYKYCKIAADENDANAQYEVGLYYEKIKPKKCLEYMLKSYDNKCIHAARALYKYYIQGKIVTKDCDKAHEYLKYYANSGDNDSQFLMGEYYRLKDNHDEAIYWYKHSSDNGNIYAQVELCNYHLGGYKIFDNDKILYSYLIKNQNNVTALYLLGYYYENIKYVFSDAYYWYIKSAKKNHIESVIKISDFYYNGIGIDKNEDEGFDWLLKAADLGHIDSQYLVGRNYEIGFTYKNNFIQSDKKAIKYYKLAASKDHTLSIESLKYYNLLNQIK